MQFADPKNDLAFKKIFGNEQHTEILISFLNSVLDFKDEKEIVNVSLANPYQIPKIPELKETILDIQAKNRKGETFIVEMQKRDLGDFAKRSLYYTSKAYVSSLDKGKNYSELKKVYFIGIVNFEIFENKNYISRHLIINQETKQQDLEDFEFYFLELPKFKKELNELKNVLDKWIYFLKNASDLLMIPKEFKEKPFNNAFDIAKQTNWDKKELEVYEYVALKEMDEINALKTAEKKGFQRGIERGIEKGKEAGKIEAKIEIVKNLLKSGVDFKIIELSTGFNIDEIEEIAKNFDTI